MMITFAYPYILGRDNGIELKYSLQSIGRHYGCGARVIIAGDKPDWFNNKIEVIAAPDRKAVLFGSFLNSMDKLRAVSEYVGAGTDFVWMHDDMYFLKHVPFDELMVPKAKCDALAGDEWHRRTGAGSNWMQCMQNTIRILKAEGKPVYSYETHMPRVFNSTKVIEVLDRYLPDPKDRNFAARMFQFATMYYNQYVERPVLLSELPGFKLVAELNMRTEKVVSLAKEHKVMNINLWRGDMRKVLEEVAGGRFGINE